MRYEPLTVVIADDHPLFRRGMARAIERHPKLRLVGEAVDGREALSLIDALDPDVAVLDQRMPELSGIEVCAQLRLRPDPSRTAILLLSAFDDADIATSAIDSGAAGYLGKTASQGDICARIERLGRAGIADRAAASANLASRINMDLGRRRPHLVDDSKRS